MYIEENNQTYENRETSQFNIIRDDYTPEPEEICCIKEEEDSMISNPKDFQNNSVVYKGSATVSNHNFDPNMFLSFTQTLDKN